jgi:hypothetical protein
MISSLLYKLIYLLPRYLISVALINLSVLYSRYEMYIIKIANNPRIFAKKSLLPVFV